MFWLPIDEAMPNRILLLSLLSFALTALSGAVDQSELIGCEWSVRPAGTEDTTAVMRFDADGTVVNTTTQGFGHYFFLNDDRLLIEFTDSLIIGQLKKDGGVIMMSGYIGAPQPMNLILSPADEASNAAAEELYRKRVAMQKQHQTELITRAITNNLRQIASAAQQYMLDAGVGEVRYGDIVGEGKLIEGVQSINGEDYSGLTLDFDSTAIMVTDADGNVVTYEF